MSPSNTTSTGWENGGSQQLYFASDLKARLSWSDGVPEVCVGSGSQRRSYRLNSPELTAILLTHPDGASKEALAVRLQEALGIKPAGAEKLIAFLSEEGIVTADPSPQWASACRWESCGWQDALDFHLATEGLEFNKDPARYVKEMRQRLSAVTSGSDLPVPDSFKYHPASQQIPLPDPTNTLRLVSIEAAFRASLPFRSYKPGAIHLSELADLLHYAYRASSEHMGLIGHYFKRTSPSGGARHPIEAYVCVNAVESLATGLYHYLPGKHALELLELGDFRERLTKNCFQKPGIQTASVVIILTVRWFRHMWKYRYSRSYRMVLFDVGHLIQTHLLVGAALGIQSFPCPSLYDTGCQALLGLGSDAEEGVVYAIGMGLQKPSGEGESLFPEHAF